MLTVKDDTVSENQTAKEESQQQQQHAAAYLRERFLKSINSLNGKNCDFKMVGNITVSGQFISSDGEMKNFLVSDLKTPGGTEKRAVLRTSDIISVHTSDFGSVTE